MNRESSAHIRLRRRQALLEQRAQWHLERAKVDLAYLRTDGIKIVGSQITDSIVNSIPLLGKILKIIGRGNNDDGTSTPYLRQSNKTNQYRSNGSRCINARQKESSILSSIATAVLPTLYTIGGMKLLSSSLKGAGKVIRSGIGRLFRRRRK